MIRERWKLRHAALVFGFSVAALGACGRDPSGPSIREVQGVYVATSLLVTENGNFEDLVWRGALVELILGRGIATGEVVLPGEGGSMLLASGTGTWELEGNRVLLHPASDGLPPPSDPNLPPPPPSPAELLGETVVLSYEGGRLTGELTVGQARVAVDLRRQ